jgi:hypothetical protein
MVEGPTLGELPLKIDQTRIDKHDHRSNADDYSQADALSRLMSQALEGVRDRTLEHFHQCNQE